MSCCRFCKSYSSEERMFKYGRRHYAHFECYLDAGKKLSDLPAWKVGRFPYRLLKERGLAEEAERIVSTPIPAGSAS